MPLTTTDFKTARARWNSEQLWEQSSQLLLYHELAKPLADGRPIRLQFAVLTKTKAPELALHAVSADDGRIQRVKRVVSRVWDAMQSGIIYPNPSPQRCPSCPFRPACDAWRG